MRAPLMEAMTGMVSAFFSPLDLPEILVRHELVFRVVRKIGGRLGEWLSAGDSRRCAMARISDSICSSNRERITTAAAPA